MKKLIVLSAAVVMAAIANAAAVTWNSGAASAGFKDPDGNKLTTAMGYTMVVTVFSDAAGTEKVLTSSSATANAMTGNFTATTGDVLAADKTYYIQAVIQNDDYVNQTDVLAFSTPATGNSTVNFTTGIGLNDVSGAAWGGWSSKATPPDPVPEPTSGLLMLLGVVGLALRRRRA